MVLQSASVTLDLSQNFSICLVFSDQTSILDIVEPSPLDLDRPSNLPQLIIALDRSLSLFQGVTYPSPRPIMVCIVVVTNNVSLLAP